jgi:hypothetical protein
MTRQFFVSDIESSSGRKADEDEDDNSEEGEEDKSEK